MTKFIDIVLHLDVYLAAITAEYGTFTYLILFLIIFAETGLVVFPFLPGDSLLFAAGAICAVSGSAMDIGVLLALLSFAAILGNMVNYTVGYFVGPRVFNQSRSKWFNKDHLLRTQEFYDKYGGLTIVITRFMPIVRTFAPFVAGIGKMSYKRFFAYNVAGGLLWVLSLGFAGYVFGNLPVIQRNFHIVIIAIVLISVSPMMIAWLKARMSGVADS